MRDHLVAGSEIQDPCRAVAYLNHTPTKVICPLERVLAVHLMALAGKSQEKHGYDDPHVS